MRIDVQPLSCGSLNRTRSDPHDTEMRFIDGGRLAQLTREPLVDAARRAMPQHKIKQVEWLTEYDAYYTDRQGEKRLPMPPAARG